MAETTLRATMIVELLGRPADHAKKALEDYMKQLDDLKEIDVTKKTFSDPKKVDEDNELYACFCEVEFTCPDFEILFGVLFDFMPSSVEIMEPSKLSLENYELTQIIGNLMQRLHRFDDAVKILQNREKKMIQEGKFMRKLLLDHNLIDKDGKILVDVLPKEEKGEDKKGDKKKRKDKGKKKKKD